MANCLQCGNSPNLNLHIRCRRWYTGQASSSKICARPQNIAGAFRMTPVDTPYLSIDLRRNMVIKNAALRLY